MEEPQRVWNLSDEKVKEKLARELALNTFINLKHRPNERDVKLNLLTREPLTVDMANSKALVAEYKMQLQVGKQYVTNSLVDTVYYEFRGTLELPYQAMLSSVDYADSSEMLNEQIYYFYALRQHLRTLRRLMAFAYFRQHRRVHFLQQPHWKDSPQIFWK